MSNTKHTPGEWTLRLGAKDDRLAPIMVDSEKANMAICKVIRDDSRPLEEQQANAELIARSPILLATLQTIAQNLTDAQNDGRELTIYEAGILKTIKDLKL